MSSPEYGASLTDPLAEVDEAFKAVKRACERYGLAYFLLVSHPAGDGTVKHQLMVDVVAPAKAEQLYSGLGLQIDAISRGKLALVHVGQTDEDGDEASPDEWEGQP